MTDERRIVPFWSLRLCPLHGEPLGPLPARNCPACRSAIDATLAEADDE